jgi:hypothetical protein
MSPNAGGEGGVEMNEAVGDVLTEVILKFPRSDITFYRKILTLISKLGVNLNNKLKFASSNNDFYPKISIDTNSKNGRVLAEFRTSEGCNSEVFIENTTGIEKKSPLKYSHLSIDSVIERFSENGLKINGLDHIGFNLPWFSPDVHPLIENLRRDFASKCLYHKFPTGEPWDFIIPGSKKEILMQEEVDYSKTRKPKFELVSFDASSTPLVQFDVQCNKPFEVFSRNFPEAIHDRQFKNIWIYTENTYNIDICIVLNESTKEDWSLYFRDTRLFP